MQNKSFGGIFIMALPVIPIFFAVDDNYAPFLGVALESITRNASRKFQYNVHILTEGLNDQNVSRLSKYNDDNFNIIFNDVADGIRTMSHRLHVRDYYTKATYYRFLISDMFPEYDRGLYLDCDIIVRGDVSELYNCDLGDNLVAAMNEEVMLAYDVYGTYVEKVLGLSRNTYFNAGVLVLNLDLFRKVDMQARLLDIISEYTFTVTQDEDYLNVLCHGSVLLLPQYWNKNSFPGCEKYGDPAKIVHYKINWKPWHYDGVGYEEDFWHYAKQTEYYEDIRAIRDNYSPADVARDNMQFEQLAETARKDTLAAMSADYVLPIGHTIKIPAEV